jgi:hypothetical protein
MLIISSDLHSIPLGNSKIVCFQWVKGLNGEVSRTIPGAKTHLNHPHMPAIAPSLKILSFVLFENEGF